MLSIAVIDDEPDLVTLFSKVLQQNGYQVYKFNDSLEALDHIGKNPHKYNLIVSDFRIPRLNGYQLITKLKEKNPHFKTILMFAFIDVQYDSSITLISKPILLSQLVSIVKKTLCN
ncbi:MAG TPA: response regulator [Nitrososphaeraceae archaeon]|jgi:DNA-binding NtrC family response regulator|nr:response regulator [Nitrososphaeraceae archaeon]